MIIIIIFCFIILLSLTAISTLLLTEHKALRQKIAKENSLQIAESGLNYYRWRLAHDRDNFTEITDQPYYDSSGSLVGYYSIAVDANETSSYGARVTLCHKPGSAAERTIVVSSSAWPAHQAHGDELGECSSTHESNTSVISITSTGRTTEYPNMTRTVKARYGKPSLAKYAFVTNSNIWFGEGENVSGLIHSNGGIRMDGNCDSRMTTIKETYICGTEHGCSDEEKPGIWSLTQESDLWDFPVADGVDFNGITVDLDAIKTAAIASGKYFGPSTEYGYKVTFSDDGTYDVKKVKKLEDPVWSYNGTDWVYDSISYKTSFTNVGTYNNPENGLLFFEDNVWVEGTVDGRITLAAARLPDDSYPDANIYIQNSINYAALDGSTVLGLIAQNDILIPLYSANDLVIDAAMIAQKGHIYRNFYSMDSYPDDATKNSIQIYGTIISNGIWTFNWVYYAGGDVESGYMHTQTTYDPYLLYGPPPSFPAEDEYNFISWEEINN